MIAKLQCLSFIYFLHFVCRSGCADLHQPLDAIVEEFNADVKTWVAGEANSDMWRRIIRNYHKLVELRQKVSALCDRVLVYLS